MLRLIHAGLSAGPLFQTDGGLESRSAGLTPAGLIIMTVSLGAIVTLVLWCYSKVLRGPGPEPHGGGRKDART